MLGRIYEEHSRVYQPSRKLTARKLRDEGMERRCRRLCMYYLVNIIWNRCLGSRQTKSSQIQEEVSACRVIVV
eukprot:4595432-Amphidinium_carterae.1